MGQLVQAGSCQAGSGAELHLSWRIAGYLIGSVRRGFVTCVLRRGLAKKQTVWLKLARLLAWCGYVGRRNTNSNLVVFFNRLVRGLVTFANPGMNCCW
jgi:hypothetical protein